MKQLEVGDLVKTIVDKKQIGTASIKSIPAINQTVTLRVEKVIHPNSYYLCSYIEPKHFTQLILKRNQLEKAEG